MSASLLEIGAYLTLGWSAVVASVSLEAVRRALSRRRAAPVIHGPPPRVLVVRPCAGDEPSLEQNLRSLALARRSFALRCRLAVAERSDAALPAAERAAEALRAQGIDAEVVITAARGPNRKVSQVHHALSVEAESVDVLLVADSDLDLAGADLDRLIAPLTEELLFRGLIQRGLSSRWTPWIAVAMQAAVFGAAHITPSEGWGNADLIVSLAVMGFGLGAIARLTGRLGTSIVAHALFNCIQLALLWLTLS